MAALGIGWGKSGRHQQLIENNTNRNRHAEIVALEKVIRGHGSAKLLMKTVAGNRAKRLEKVMATRSKWPMIVTGNGGDEVGRSGGSMVMLVIQVTQVCPNTQLIRHIGEAGTCRRNTSQPTMAACIDQSLLHILWVPNRTKLGENSNFSKNDYILHELNIISCPIYRGLRGHTQNGPSGPLIYLITPTRGP